MSAIPLSLPVYVHSQHGSWSKGAGTKAEFWSPVKVAVEDAATMDVYVPTKPGTITMNKTCRR